MIIRHTILYAFFSILPAFASLLSLIVLTRLMTPSQFGQYSMTVYVSTVLVSVFANFLIIGLGRFEPAISSAQQRNQLHSTVLTVALMTSAALTLLLIGLYYLGFLPQLSVNYFQLAVIFHVSVFLLLSQKLANACFHPKIYGYSQVIKNYLFLGASGILLFIGFGTDAVLSCFAISSLIAIIPTVRLWQKAKFRYFDFGVLKTLWMYGAPLTMLYVFVMIIGLSDRLFIDLMLGGDEVGFYSASFDVVQYSIGTLAAIMHLSLFPIILKTYEKSGSEETKRVLVITFKILILVMMPVAFGISVTAEDISNIVLGADFSFVANQLLPILTFAIFANVVKSYYFDYSFQIVKSTWMQVIPPLFAAVLNCFLNYYFISEVGVIGAAYATFISNIVYLLLAMYLSKRVFDMPVIPKFFFTMLTIISLMMAVIVLVLSLKVPVLNYFAFKVVIGVGVYMILLFIFLRKDVYALLLDLKSFKANF